MIIKEIAKPERSAKLVERLFGLWEASVRATHDFLSEDDIVRIAQVVRPAITEIPILLTAIDNDDKICGFLGIGGANIEMLFVAPEVFGRGVGKQLLETATRQYGAQTVDVNEQNPQAQGFYDHMGFVVNRRSEQDDYGNNFPILHMILHK